MAELEARWNRLQARCHSGGVNAKLDRFLGGLLWIVMAWIVDDSSSKGFIGLCDEAPTPCFVEFDLDACFFSAGHAISDEATRK